MIWMRVGWTDLLRFLIVPSGYDPPPLHKCRPSVVSSPLVMVVHFRLAGRGLGKDCDGGRTVWESRAYRCHNDTSLLLTLVPVHLKDSSGYFSLFEIPNPPPESTGLFFTDLGLGFWSPYCELYESWGNCSVGTSALSRPGGHDQWLVVSTTRILLYSSVPSIAP